MMTLKNINFDENNDWWCNLTVKEKSKINSIWMKYIKLKDPNDTLEKDFKARMKMSFIDGMLVGILNV